ncbi:MAG: hypothetical protein AAGL34_09645 [Bacteroidota bacterium]
MKVADQKIELYVLAFSTVLFLLLTFVVGPTNIFGLAQWIQNTTDYYFALPVYMLDYGLIAFIPFFGLLLSPRSRPYSINRVGANLLKLSLSVIIIFVLGLFLLTIISKPPSPLIPETLIGEPIPVYSVLLIGIGIGIPFLFRKRN